MDNEEFMKRLEALLERLLAREPSPVTINVNLGEVLDQP